MTQAMTARARQLRAVADQIERLQRAVSGGAEESDLLSPAQYGTNGSMHASAISTAPRIRGRDITNEGPLADAAKKLGLSIKQIAAKIGASYNTARKWSVAGKVPIDVQQKLDRLVKDASKVKTPGRSAK